MEQAKPWTAIIPLNEEYYIALKEELNLTGAKLPIIRLKSRKTQQEGHPTLLPSKPWEKYTSKEITSLYMDFNIEDPSHKDFDLQEQAKRNRERGLKAVFYDLLTLTVPYELGKKERTHFEVEFRLRRVPKHSETLKVIREDVRSLKNKHHLYSEISKRDKTYYQRIFQNPSCLEIFQIWQVANPFAPNITDELLNGVTERSQRFMSNIVVVTEGIVWDVYKKFDTQSGFILDGVVSSRLIRERLAEA